MIGKMFRLARSAAGSFAYYGTAHRVPALYYMNYSFLSMLVAAISAAALLLILLPVLRGRRATIAMSSIMMFTAMAQGYALIIPEWQVASTKLHDVPLSYWPGAPLNDCSLWLGVGLQSANVTLICDSGTAHHPYYNEHLHLSAQEEALRSSMLPPLQTAAVTITGDSGLYLRRAGQWAFAIICAAGATWLWTGLLLLAVPAAAGRAMRHLGLALLAAPALYHFLQRTPVTPALPGASEGLHLRYGASFWLCFSAGVGASLVGAALDVLAQRGLVFSTACQMESYEEESGFQDFIDKENLDTGSSSHISSAAGSKDKK